MSRNVKLILETGGEYKLRGQGWEQWETCPHLLPMTWFPAKGWAELVQCFSALAHGTAITKMGKIKKGT